MIWFILFYCALLSTVNASATENFLEMLIGVQTEGRNLQFSPGGNISIPHKSGLSPDCNNKACQMVQDVLSCKSYDLGIKKICANYLVGFLFGCSNFPPANDIYEAPSVCLNEYIGFAQDLALQQQVFIENIIGNLLNFTTYETNVCGRHCFQNYQYASNDFYQSCSNELANKTVAKDYPILGLLSVYQPFRDQACTYNNKTGVSPATCYAELGVILEQSTPATNPSPAPSASPTLAEDTTLAPTAPPPNDFYDFNCSYNTFPLPPAYQQDYNTAYKQKICSLFSATGCCTANIIGMLQQSPVPPTSPKIFPPCFLSYLNGFCPGVNLTTFCRTGATADLSTFTGTIQIPNCPTCPGSSGGKLQAFPNMYDQNSVLALMAVAAGAFGAVNNSFADEPYNLKATLPLNIEVIDFVYYNSTGGRLTPDDGTVAQPAWSDYEDAAYGVFTFQPVLNNIDHTQIAAVYEAVRSPYFAGTFSQAYAGGQNLGIPFVATQGPAPLSYGAVPLVLGTASRGVTQLPGVLVGLIVIVAWGVAS